MSIETRIELHLTDYELSLVRGALEEAIITSKSEDPSTLRVILDLFPEVPE